MKRFEMFLDIFTNREKFLFLGGLWTDMILLASLTLIGYDPQHIVLEMIMVFIALCYGAWWIHVLKAIYDCFFGES